MSLEKRMGFNHQISEEAAEWLVELRTGDIDAAGRRDFDAWMRASPEHLRAFIEMAALWNQSGAVDAQRRLDIDTILARAHGEQNVIGLSPVRSRDEGAAPSPAPEAGVYQSAVAQVARRGMTRTRRPARIAWLAAAASLLVAIVGTAWFLGLGFGPPTYGTGVGERRSISLPDGSTVVLDSRSRLRVNFTAVTREVALLQGQALFHVIRNPQRPFLVQAGETIIRDVGTQFDVNRSSDGTIVTVVEGRVAVMTRAAAAQPGSDTHSPTVSRPLGGIAEGGVARGRKADRSILLTAGEQVDVPTGEFSPQPIRVNVSSVMAWTRGQVVLNSATLQQMAQVFNRYSARRLVVEDSGAQPLRLSGVFATNPDFLIRYLRTRPDIAVTESGSEIDIIRNPIP